MGRKKKTDIVTENVAPMQEDAMNPPIEEQIEVQEEIKEEVTEPVKQDEITAPIAKRIHSPSSLVNVREKPDGEILYRLPNGQKVIVEEEKDGWCKISAYVMSELIGEL